MSETALYLLTRTYLEGPLVQEKNAKYAIMRIFCCHLSKRGGHNVFLKKPIFFGRICKTPARVLASGEDWPVAGTSGRQADSPVTAYIL